MFDIVILYTDEALEYFTEMGMFTLDNESQNFIDRCRGKPHLHFFLTNDLKRVRMASWLAHDDIAITLDEYIAWSILPTPESRELYLASLSPSDS